MISEPAEEIEHRRVRVVTRLRQINRVMLAEGGGECITGNWRNLKAPCIRSVVQLDGDILTHYRLSGNAEVDKQLIEQHCKDLRDWFGRLNRTIRDAALTIFGAITVVPAAVTAGATESLVPLYAMAGPVTIVAVRNFRRIVQIGVLAALIVASAAAVRLDVVPDAGRMLWFWAGSLVFAAIVGLLAYGMRWYIRWRYRKRR